MISEFAQKTDAGRVRSENQDRMGRFTCRWGEIFLIADGMGGEAGGAAAAALAVEAFEAQLGSAASELTITEALQWAALRVNREILAAAEAHPETGRMGATVVMAAVEGNRVTIGHAGDSRAYGLLGGRLGRLTRDHSLVEKMMAHQMLTAEEARAHPDASVITHWLGQPQGFEFEISGPFEMDRGDVLLLCSDGLTRDLEEGYIEDVLRRESAAERTAEELLTAAFDRGGEDNITVQVLRFGAAGSPPRRLHLPVWMPWGRKGPAV